MSPSQDLPHQTTPSIIPIVLTVLAVLLAPYRAAAQGSESGESLRIRFDVQGHGVKRPDGFNVGQEAFAELWVGKKGASLSPVAGPVQLNERRRFDGGTVNVPGFRIGDIVQVRLKVCFGNNFDDSDCCGFSDITERRLDSIHAFQIAPSFFGAFTACTDCDPDECFKLRPTLEIDVAQSRLNIAWRGGRLESAQKVEGPYTPFSTGLYFQDTGTHTEPARSAHKFFRVVDPCINPDPVDWDADYIESGLIGDFWHDVLERTLKVMGEPSLLEIGDTEDREVYRMFFLPSFGATTVVRFERHGNQFTKRVVMTGAGNSPLERCILYRETTDLDQTEWREFQTNFDRLDFWSLGPEDLPILLLDGAPTFIEARKGENYHIIERPTPSYKTDERGLSNYRRFFDEWVNHDHLFFP